jgi:uncharacterized paraquat-inducible protein A
MTEPVTEATTEPASEATTEPASETLSEATTEPASEPTSEPSRSHRHPSATHPPCPKCGAPLYRVHRHLLDRLRSLIRPRRRYCCRGHSCRWEGTLPYSPKED